MCYSKIPKISDIRKFAVLSPKKLNKMALPYIRVPHPKDAEGIANSVDPDQTAPLGALWSGSALFAQACLSENLGSLQYFNSGPHLWTRQYNIIFSTITQFINFVCNCYTNI